MEVSLFDIGTMGTPEFVLIAAIIALLAAIRPLIWLALLCAQPHLLSAFATDPTKGLTLYLVFVVIGTITLRISYRMKWQRLISALTVPVILLTGWGSVSFLLYPTLEGSAASSMSRIIMCGSLAPYLLIVVRLCTFEEVQLFLKYVFSWLISIQVIYAVALVYAAQLYSIENVANVAVMGVVLYFSNGGVTLVLVAAYLTGLGNLSIRNWGALVAAGMLGLLLIVLDGSRTILSVAMLSVLFIAWQRNKLTIYVAGGIASAIISLLIIFVTQPNVVETAYTTWEERLEQSKSADLKEFSSGRVMLYEQVWYSFLESPLVGVGVGNATDPSMINGVLIRQNPHSFYIGTLGQQGLLGVSLIVLIVVVGFQRGRALWRMTAATPSQRPLVLLVVTLVGYGGLSMTFKADYGITFWALGLLEVLYHATHRANANRGAIPLTGTLSEDFPPRFADRGSA